MLLDIQFYCYKQRIARLNQNLNAGKNTVIVLNKICKFATMERLVINIPERKSTLVKQILKGLGVTIQQENQSIPSAYKQKLTKVTTWSDEDLSVFEESKNAFENLKPQQW